MDHKRSVFINCILNYFLSQVVLEPTSHTLLLKLVLTNGESIIDEVRVEKNLGANDYNIIRFNLKYFLATNFKFGLQKR